jgi:3'-5' exoribonuclease
MIKDMKAGERICQAVLLRVQKIGNSSNGGIFAKGVAEDNSGHIQFICFERELVNKFRDFDGPRAMIVSGPVDIIKFSTEMALQVIIQKLDKIMPEDDISYLLPQGNFNLTAYKEKLNSLIGQVKTPSVHQLLEKIFTGSFYEAFCRNPAGMKLHHAYAGGLLQHSVDVAELALAMAYTIGKVDKDLIIAGALLHDIGKVREISASIGFPYTTEGRLLGHIAMSAMMVKQAAAEMKLTDAHIQLLEHIILSHHGEQEKGSPVACATKESFIVHYADELNAIMNQFEAGEHNTPWEFNKMLQRYLFVKN